MPSMVGQLNPVPRLLLGPGPSNAHPKYLRLTLGRGRVSIDMEEAIHDGNLVLGLVALRHGDKERAKQHLLASVRTEGSFEMKMVGPNLSLAHELLKAGERETVLEYLDGCKCFWRGERGELEHWKARIRNGEDPEFDGLYFSASTIVYDGAAAPVGNW